MPPPDLISLFVVPLNNLNVRYMITGAAAPVICGLPRFTRDPDLVLDLPPGSLSGEGDHRRDRLKRALVIPSKQIG